MASAPSTTQQKESEGHRWCTIYSNTLDKNRVRSWDLRFAGLISTHSRSDAPNPTSTKSGANDMCEVRVTPDSTAIDMGISVCSSIVNRGRSRHLDSAASDDSPELSTTTPEVRFYVRTNRAML